MAFFQTTPLKKSALYAGSGKLCTTSSSNSNIGSPIVGRQQPQLKSGSMGRAAQLAAQHLGTVRVDEKALSQAMQLSDDEFVHNINQIIRRKGCFRLIDRQTEMTCQETHVRVCIDAVGFQPSELNVRLSGLGAESTEDTQRDRRTHQHVQQDRDSSNIDRHDGPKLEVHGEHLEYVSKKLAIRKQLVRCYRLPPDVDTEHISCSFSKKHCTLTITIPRLTTVGSKEMQDF